jgi:hypothetical protein
MALSPSITTISNSPPADPELRNTVAALRSSMRDGACLTEPLSVMTRGRLGMRLDLLRGCAKQAAPGQIETEVAKLMTSYPSLRGSSATDAAAMIYQYTEALAGVPLWAVRDACKAIARGAVPDINPDFAPSSARLRKLVDDAVSALHAEARNIKSLLEAPVVLPDNSETAVRVKETVVTGLRTLSKKLDDDDRAARLPQQREAGSGFKALQGAALTEYYRTHNWLGQPKPPQRNVTDDDTVTVDETFRDDRRAVGG